MWNLNKYSDNTAIIDDSNHAVSYAEISLKAEHLKRAVSKRKLILILCKNSIGSIVSYVSTILQGSVPIMVRHDLDTELLNRIFEAYKPHYLFLPKSRLRAYKNVETVIEFYDYVLVKTQYDSAQLQYEIHKDLCQLISTSGSTGSPKFVRHSYKNVESNSRSISEYLKLDEHERPMLVLPMYYAYGLSVINSHLMTGGTILLTDKNVATGEFYEYLKESKATSLSGVPYTYEMLNFMHFQDMDLPDLKTLTQAGGHLSSKLQKIFATYCNETSRNFYVMYGQSEATARMSYLSPELSLTHLGSIGKPIPGGSFELLDDSNLKISKSHVTGELIYKGPNVSMGYALGCDDLGLDDENHGVLKTGDLAFYDDDGYFYICGRKKRFLKINDSTLSLDELDEMVTAQFPDIVYASWGRDDHLYLFVADQVLLNPLRDYVLLKTGINPLAVKAVLLDRMPRNSSGKVLYRELENYVNQNLSDSSVGTE
ncbi:MAG: AMP-binding protein [Succinivibrio sp.]